MNPIPHISFQQQAGIPGFEVVDLQELFSRDEKSLGHNPFKAHRLNFFALLLISSGQVRHQLDFQTFTLVPGDCMLIAKDQIHAFDKGSTYQGYMVLFTEKFLLEHVSPSTTTKISRLYDYHLNPSHYHSPAENAFLLEHIEKEYSQLNAILSPSIIAAILSIYLLKIEGYNQKQSADYSFDRSYTLFHAFKRKVEAAYSQSRNAQFYADQLAISYKHLNEITKKFTHKTAKVFIDDYVMLEAKRFLSATTLSIKEVGFQCGFDEATNFLKYFKKAAGQTPMQFREMQIQVRHLPSKATH